MSILYAGDIHTNTWAVKQIDEICREQSIPYVVQVGDFGLHFSKTKTDMYEYFKNRDQKNAPIWITCGGNHDNWNIWQNMPPSNSPLNDSPHSNLKELAPNCFFAERGSTLLLEEKLHMFFGGAESTDRHHRVEGQDWWEKETPNWQETNRFGSNYEELKPEVLVTHDCPWVVPLHRYDRDTSNFPTRNTLQNIWLHFPDHPVKEWYFGHHHKLEEWKIDTTLFRCCGIEGQYWIKKNSSSV